MADIRYDQEPALTGTVLGTDLFCISRSPYGAGAPFQKLTMTQVAAYMANSVGALPLWNASTNTPTLTSSTVGSAGIMYIVSVPGTTTLNGISSWAIEDYAYFTGGVWTKISRDSFGVSQFIVGTTSAVAPYTSIQTAITAAAAIATSSNRQIVYIQAGAYTENITLAPNVDICGLMEGIYNDLWPVQITGNITLAPSSPFVVNIENIHVQSTSSAALNISTSTAVTVNISNCFIRGVGVNGITNTNANAVVNMWNSTLTSNLAPFSMASGYLSLIECQIQGYTSNCLLSGNGSSVNGVVARNSSFFCIVEISGTNTLSNFSYCNFINSGASSALIMSGTSNIVSLRYVSLQSNASSTYAVDGIATNTINVGDVTFEGTATGMNPALTFSFFPTSMGALSFNGGATYLTPTITANANATFPGGTYTVAKVGDNFIGNITPFVVGPSSTVAPYTSINAAITDANTAYTSTGSQQTVYIQPGIYAQSVTPQQGVDIIGLGCPNIVSTSSQWPVVINGQLVITNTMSISISGINLNNTAAATISATGTNGSVVNFVSCLLQKTSGAGGSLFSSSNPNIGCNFLNCNIEVGGSLQAFIVQGQSFTFTNCFQRGTAAGISVFTGVANISYNNCTIVDTIELATSGGLTINNSSLTSRGNYAGCIFQTNSCTFMTNYSTFNVAPGFTNYVFSGASGTAVTINNATYTDLMQIDPNLTITSYAQSPNLGNASVYTGSAAVTLTQQNSIVAINKIVPAATTVNLPATGTAIGQPYTIVDQARNAATYNITLTPASGNIQGGATFAMNINGQSVTVIDFGTEYTIV